MESAQFLKLISTCDVALFWCCVSGSRRDAAQEVRELCLQLPLGKLARKVWISRSATEGCGCLALSQVGPVGVDIEVGSSGEDRLAARDIEQWALSEAVLKAFGVGLSVSPQQLNAKVSDDWLSQDVSGLGSVLTKMICGPLPGLRAALAIRTNSAPVTLNEYGRIGRHVALSP